MIRIAMRTDIKKVKNYLKSHKSMGAIIAIGCIGVILLAISRAAGYSISINPETGTTTGATTKTTDTTAAGGSAIQFGTKQTAGNTTDYILIKRAELMAKPTSGPGWDYMKQVVDQPWETPRLGNGRVRVHTRVLGAALIYARTGDVTYRDKVINALKQIPGSYTASSESDGGSSLLDTARTTYAYVMAADLIGFSQSTVCNNGQTWRQFLEEVRTKEITGNTRWKTLEFTSQDSASNWGTYALSSHLAVSIALNDTAAISRNTEIFKRYLGDTTSTAPPFNPSSSYKYNDNGATWDMTPTLQRGINPDVAGDRRSGSLVEDLMRSDYDFGAFYVQSVPCCTVYPTGRLYQAEIFDGLLAINMLFKARSNDYKDFQNQAIRRAFDFYMRNGGPYDPNSGDYLPIAINKWYGTNYEVVGDSYARHLGYGNWLF